MSAVPRATGNHLGRVHHLAGEFLLTPHILARRIWLGGQDLRAGPPV
jgi:hypothetical protein